MIYPIDAKYSYSYPYLTLFHRFREELPSSLVLLIIGHSMRDEAINDIVASCLVENPDPILVFIDPNTSKIDFLNKQLPFSSITVKERPILIEDDFSASQIPYKITNALVMGVPNKI
ncbi:MAG: hypothetical protein QXR44_02260 [Thermoproteota archaeon]